MRNEHHLLSYSSYKDEAAGAATESFAQSVVCGVHVVSVSDGQALDDQIKLFHTHKEEQYTFRRYGALSRDNGGNELW